MGDEDLSMTGRTQRQARLLPLSPRKGDERVESVSPMQVTRCLRWITLPYASVWGTWGVEWDIDSTELSNLKRFVLHVRQKVGALDLDGAFIEGLF